MWGIKKENVRFNTVMVNPFNSMHVLCLCVGIYYKLVKFKWSVMVVMFFSMFNIHVIHAFNCYIVSLY